VARSGPAFAVAAAVVAAAVAAGAIANQAETRRRQVERVHALTGGDPDLGRAAVAARPCGGCHAIPGIPGAAGKVGPSLTGFAGRLYIGGRASNTPDNLVQWIEDPHQIDPQSAMPPMGIGEKEARDIAAYLYTLQ
jgi:cytochrome c2